MENGTPPALPLREVNERGYEALLRFGAEQGDFACECGEKDCHDRVELLVIEYAARDERPLLAPGHTEVAPAIS